MIFTSFEFVGFFLFVAVVRSFLQSFNTDKWFLLAVSYAFYMSWSVPCAFLIFVTSLVDYWVGIALEKVEDAPKRKLLLVVSIIANLGVLGTFKYTNFMLENAGWGLAAMGFDVRQWRFDIILPAGISFFTFQSMTYTIETYRRNLKPCHSLRDFLLFVAFFPQLLAGPINRAADLLPQFSKRARATAQDVEIGLSQFAIGAIKKLVISDRIAPNVDLIFSNPGNYDALTLVQGALGYSVQIYCDFSGYSDMAIGSARMMGFRFMENFQFPYSSTNITEFWRRWHISLSSWFRDYLYIPLGGNRHGPTRTYANLLITMLLCGLWHGPSWNFVFWGGLHGVCLALHRVWKGFDPLKRINAGPVFRFTFAVSSHILTLAIVVVGWIFFRSTSWADAIQYVARIFTWDLGGVRLLSPYIIPAVALVVLVHLILKRDSNWAHRIPEMSVPVRIAAYSTLFVILCSLGAVDSAPFIYFQF